MILDVINGEDKFKNGHKEYIKILFLYSLQRLCNNLNMMLKIKKDIFLYQHTQILKVNLIQNKEKLIKEINGLKKCHGV
jgi:hypothetical protein